MRLTNLISHSQGLEQRSLLHPHVLPLHLLSIDKGIAPAVSDLSRQCLELAIVDCCVVRCACTIRCFHCQQKVFWIKRQVREGVGNTPVESLTMEC